MPHRDVGRHRAAVVLVIAAIALVMACVTGCATPHASADGADSPQMVGHPDAIGPAPVAVRKGALWYQLVLGGSTMEVRLRLLRPANTTSFFLPGPWAGRDDFSRAIELEGAFGPHGRLDMTIQRDQGRIDVPTAHLAWVELRYQVRLRRGKDESWRLYPSFKDGVFFAYGPAFLILPSEQVARTLRDIPIEVRAPDAWRVIATWHRVHVAASRAVRSDRVYGYVVGDLASLRDAFVAAGPQLDIRAVGAPAKHVRIAFDRNFRGPRRAFVKAVNVILSAYQSYFGRQHAVTIFVRTLPHATEHESHGMGRHDGFVLGVPSHTRIDPPTLVLIAHEAFHLWNGHELVPNPSSERRTRWFKEGVTQYVALQTLRRLGLIGQDFLWRELAKAGLYYQRNPAAHGAPSTQRDRARLPYDRGLLLAMRLDAALRSESHGRLTLQAWVRTLVEHAREAPSSYYDQDDLRRSLVNFSGDSGDAALAVWDRYVQHGLTIPVARFFAAVGLHWWTEAGGQQARLLPLAVPHPAYEAIFRGP